MHRSSRRLVAASNFLRTARTITSTSTSTSTSTQRANAQWTTTTTSLGLWTAADFPEAFRSRTARDFNFRGAEGTDVSPTTPRKSFSPGAWIRSQQQRQRHRHVASAVALELSSSSSLSSRRYGYRDFLERKAKEGTVVLSYLTDIEGDKFYLDRYVDNSKVLKWIQQQQQRFPYDRRIDFSDSNSILVFGGDLWDKGGFDLYVTRQLLDLKRRYPERVVWVLGNRDINKLRMMQELGLPPNKNDVEGSNGDADVSVPYHPGLTWFRGSGRVGDPDGPLPSMDPGDRLRWILGNTMGSPDAMEHRRQELAWEARGCREDCCLSTNTSTSTEEETEEAAAALPEISDCDVVRSYQESCHPNGEMGRFLSEALLAAKIGPVLFVHGSLPLTKDTMARARARASEDDDNNDSSSSSSSSIWDDLTFCMPWINKTYHEYEEDHVFDTASDLGVETIEDWLEAVNGFAFQNIEAWEKDIARLEPESKSKSRESGGDPLDEQRFREGSKETIWAYRGGYGNGPSYAGIYYSDLVQYGMGMIPGGEKNPTVVYNSFTPEGMPTFFLPPEEEGVTPDDENDEAPPNSAIRASESDVALCTREFFERSSMRLILTGHKPQGDMPSPIRVDQSSWVICADTSYSGDTKWFHDERNSTSPENRSNLGRGNSISFRGDTAVSEVLVELSGETLSLASVRYHGVLSDGTEYESVNLLDAGDYEDAAASAATFLGRVAPTHMVPDPSHSPHEGRWWTKGICRDGSHLYYAGEGYNVWNYIVSPSDQDETNSTDDETDDAVAESNTR
eukprot:jgi/Psemu1/261633/estExt_Genewise1Plus.C_6030021